MPVKYEYTSHENISHDSIDSLGYDWDRTANPDVAPKYPLKLYLPRTTADVVAAIRETKELGQTMKIRSRGHSSNDLVLADGGVVMSTEKLNRLVSFDPQQRTVTVQSGAVTAKLDRYLGKRGYGLPVVGDHNDITAGGFASVGGFSPASIRYGMFIDNISAFEYVTWDGEVVQCTKADNRELFFTVLMGTGQYGVITTLTLNIIRVNKWREMLASTRTFYKTFDDFIAATTAFIADHGDAVMERIVWLDFPTKRGEIRFGQLSAYYPTNRSVPKLLRNAFQYRYLHTLGWWAGRLPAKLDQIVKLLGFAGIMFAPSYSTIKNVETLTDLTLDTSVGDPTRMLAVIAPVQHYERILRELYRICLKYREEHSSLTMIALYVKALESDFLDNLVPGTRFCELLIYLNINKANMTEVLTEALVSEIDDMCIEHGAMRYMHTKTVKDPERRNKIDPNAVYVRNHTGKQLVTTQE